MIHSNFMYIFTKIVIKYNKKKDTTKKIIAFALLLFVLVFSVYLVSTVISFEHDDVEIYCDYTSPQDLVFKI
jgi:uncharacterized membrane protein (DUF373 family)